MKKINNYIGRYLLYSFPAVLGMFIWGFFQSQAEVVHSGNKLFNVIRELLSWHLIFWFIILIYALVLLLGSPVFREKVLTRLAKIKDRDERESIIIGQSTRFTFFSTLALLIGMLFFLTIDFSLIKLPEEKAVNGKQHVLSIGLSFSTDDGTITRKESNRERVLFSTRSVPVSMQIIILLFIAWHLGTFYYSSYRYSRVNGL